MIIKNSLRSVVVLLAALAVCSCAKETVSMETVASGSDELMMAPQSTLAKDNQPSTKGIPATTSTLKTVVGDAGIDIVAFTKTPSGAWMNYLSDVLLDWNTTTSAEGVSSGDMNKWKSGDDTHYYWPKTNPLDFWAVAPAGKVTASISPELPAQKLNLSFNYTVPTGASAGADAVAQTDIMVAYDGNVYQSTHNGFANMSFAHTMAAIRFEVKETYEGTLHSIAIKNVIGEGTCTCTPASYTPSATTGVVWNLNGKNADKTYTQSFETSLKMSKGVTNQQVTDAEGYTDGSRTFMMIPQTFTGSEKFVVKFNDLTFEVPIKIVNGEDETKSHLEWKAGVKYTYVLSIVGGEITIDVKEDWDPEVAAVKGNVAVQNTGDHNSYVRLAVVANWVDKDNNIVKACDWTNEGNLVGLNDEDWTKQPDGYYYYVNGIEPKAMTKYLFTSYAPGNPPAAGLDLEMVIIAQAVEFDSDSAIAKEYWGVADGVLSGEVETTEETTE